MKTVVITGGTDGIGRAPASELLGEGATVLFMGRNPAKGREFLTAADKAGAAGRARFVTADLSLLAESGRAVAEIRAEFPVVDALVLCARHYRSRRTVTSEGLEENFALFYLGRRLFGQGPADAPAAAQAPVVVNVAGPGAPLDTVRWEDLELRHGYVSPALHAGGTLFMSFSY
ncbi:SDR family NAD(P)-dependent oxidoreductase [Streptosporangium sp. NBC_01469]|uniref:SDR family NAD(P)-dependent oxidoreductase n=1 Tax=Streptosporangium sp. NBC_01469 TaxID=2903898 RepID=UPI002E2D4FB3|nr:SDR family NAD(P)-dependent oxidoreductase [Streptosporangium sp. NBC_01469]